MKLIIKQTNKSNSPVLILPFSVGGSGCYMSHAEVRASGMIERLHSIKKIHFINIMHDVEIGV